MRKEGTAATCGQAHTGCPQGCQTQLAFTGHTPTECFENQLVAAACVTASFTQLERHSIHPPPYPTLPSPFSALHSVLTREMLSSLAFKIWSISSMAASVSTFSFCTYMHRMLNAWTGCLLCTEAVGGMSVKECLLLMVPCEHYAPQHSSAAGSMHSQQSRQGAAELLLPGPGGC